MSVVALCSGGFDSITLLHDLRFNNPDLEIHTLFFNYGQRSEEAEERCAENASKKLNCTLHKVTIPPITWTKSNFYGEGYKDAQTQYLEYRNLIFFSYALSLAQSIGANKVYAAILKSHWGYADTSKDFIHALNTLSALQGICIETPYASLDKEDLFPLAYKCGVYTGEWFSCDVPSQDPNTGLLKPCGECLDCNSLIEADYLLRNTPFRELKKYGRLDTTTPDFKNSIETAKINELRVLVNNDCQLNCKHCFYGFKDMISEPLTVDEMYGVIEEAIALGVKSLHYSGKEPLFDDKIFTYIERVHSAYPKVRQSIVTNGINVPKYAQKLKEYEVEMFLSVDASICSTHSSLRSKTPIVRALDSLLEQGISTTAFIDLYEGNYDKVYDLIDFLRINYPNVWCYHIRTIRPIGNADSMKPLSEDKVLIAIEQAYNYSQRFNINSYLINIDVGADYVSLLKREDNSFISQCVHNIEDISGKFNSRFNINWELFCSKYTHTITVSPDGYIFGCGMELANPQYDTVSVGSVRDNSLKDLVTKGKQKCFEINCENTCGEEYCFNSCKFNK